MDEGAATTASDLADPTTSSDYAVCVYEGPSGGEHLVYEAGIPASTLWTARPRGYRYFDRAHGERGVRRVVLKSGGAAASEIDVRATGATYYPSAFVIASPVKAQLVNLPSNLCWESAFTATDVQTTDYRLFKARIK